MNKNLYRYLILTFMNILLVSIQLVGFLSVIMKKDNASGLDYLLYSSMGSVFLTVYNTFIMPFVIIIPNIIFVIIDYIFNKKHIIIGNILCMIITAIFAVGLTYLRWGICFGRIFSPDNLTKAMTEGQLFINLISVSVVGIILQCIFIIIHRRANKKRYGGVNII